MESGDIKLINSNSIHKICSGQVVLSLGTAVKELVENSIDAGASIIDVKLKEYGSELIEVIDNGKGVHSSDFQNITLKHHTSKIKEFSDVQFVSTFGFRGEALSSLCALSDVEIVTCHYDSPVGTLLVYDHGGLLVKKSSTHRQVGTTVIVKNLFFTLPVRHKEFHRNLRREYAKMLQTLTAYCLISVKKKISCTNWTEKGRKTIAISSNCCDSYKDNILCIFGRKQVDSLIEFVQISPSLPILEEYFLPPNAIEKCNVFQIEGFVSNSCHGEGRSSTERQFFYVNGRPCDLPKVSKLINDVYHSFNKAQYPFVFLNINVMEGSADVNIVPDKRQIFLPDQKLLLCIIKASLHQMYQFQPSEMKISSVSLLFQKNTPDIVYQAAAQEAQAQAALKIEKLEEISQKRKLDTSDLEENSPKEFRMDLLGYKTLNSGGGHTQPVDQQKTVSRPLRSQSKVTKHSTYSDVNLLLSAKDKNKKLQQVLQKGTNSFSTSKACSLPELTPNVSAGANAEEEILDKFHLRRKKVQTIAFSIETIKRENKNMCKTKFTCDYRKFRSKITPSENNFAEEELKKEIKKEDFSRMDIIGQFNLGFIVTRLDDDLFIIDQHATDEKYNFETLQRLTVLETQKLLNPQNLNLTAVSETILIDNLHIFEKSGFGFSIDEDNLVGSKVQLVSVPVSQNWRFGKEDVEEMIFMLTDNPVSMVRPSRINQMFASRACRKSVMIGTALPTQAMKKLILHMGEIEQPWNCPHGRPTMRHLLNLSMLQSSGSQTVNKNLKTKTNNCL